MKRIETSKIQEFEIKNTERLREIAPECMVLLKKNGDFPLNRPDKIALYGSGARHTIKGGTGSGDVNVRHFVTVEEGIEKAGCVVTTKDWLDSYDQIKQEAHVTFIEEIKKKAEEKGIPAFFMGLGAVMPEPEYRFPLNGEGDTAIYVLARISGEGSDRQQVAGDFQLTQTEKRDILMLAKKYKRLLLVLNVGGVIDLSDVMEVPNILLLSQLGTVTGDAFADVLMGNTYPSGKLTSTWATAEAYSNVGDFGHQDDTRYNEGIYVGYRYFDTVKKEPLFPFGFGLGYTEFSINYHEFVVENKTIKVTVSIKNKGKMSGKETVQLYYSAPNGKLDKPYQELGTFAKTEELKQGEETTIILSLPIENMASYDTKQAAWILEKGIYTLRVGTSSRNTTVCGAVSLDADAITEELKNVGGEVDFKDWVPEESNSKSELPKGTPVIEIRASDIIGIGHYDCNKKVEVKDQEEEINLETFTKEELANVCVGKYKESVNGVASVIGSAAFSVAGAGGETAAIIKEKGYGSLVLADGPAGIRISTEYILNEDQVQAKGLGSIGMYLELFDENMQKILLSKVEAAKEASKEKPTYYQYCSAIPIGTALAQSWNLDLCRICGDLVGEEMELFGIQIWLAPALNIHRSPLCGRNFEYYSEDPLISGRMAVAVTDGVQAHSNCGVTIKHFACNNQETNRFRSNSIVGERALREIYLKGFEIAVKEAQPHAIMTSYNLLNGVHTCNRKDLLTEVLRGEWGFEGIAMTDWNVTSEGFFAGSKYPCASSAGCITAGNDLIMPGEAADKEEIIKAMEQTDTEYHLLREELEICARRILSMTRKLSY